MIDTPSLKGIITIVISFIGTILIVKPSLLFNIPSNDDSKDTDPNMNIMLGSILLLVTMNMKGLINIYIRKFGKSLISLKY